MTEILVVDRAAFFGGDWPQGFQPMAGADAAAFLRAAGSRARFVDRPTAEANPAWKQWIPYCVLRCAAPIEAGAAAGRAAGGDAAGEEAGVLTVRRTKGQSEARLHGAWSIGLGGHVEPVDGRPDHGGGEGAGAEAFFAKALGRELAEELDLQRVDLPEPRFEGLLNDDGTEVGRVHAGLVYTVDLPLPLAAARDRLRIRETSKMHGGFTSLVEFADLWLNPAQFESWSQLLVRAGIVRPIGGCRSALSCVPNG